MTEKIQVADMLGRMAKREKVLLDQASSLARHMSSASVELNILRVITTPDAQTPRPIEIAYVSGTEREPCVTFNCIITPPPSWSVQLKQIADAGLSISAESAAAGIDPGQASTLLRNLAKRKSVHVLSEAERKSLSCLALESLDIKTTPEEWSDLLRENDKIEPPFGRAGPDAIWTYRTMRQLINGDRK